MFKKTLLIALAGFLACCVPSRAQDEAAAADPATTEKPKPGDNPGPGRFWQAKLSGGHFMVALDRIASVSRHKYVLDGAVIVDEVTVDTVGQALARFYFITPVTNAGAGKAASDIAARGQELLDKAAERVGTDSHEMVGKKYGVTSHAKSIEYRLLAEKDLDALYTSVRNAWESGRGRQFSVK
jgi:hypothetical protein